MSESIQQPPYIDMASALRQADVLDVAELSAMRVASGVIIAQGHALPNDTEELDDTKVGARLALAMKVIGRHIDQRTLALALMQAPNIAMAVAENPGSAAIAMMTQDLFDAWRRNWTDYALLTAAISQ